MNHLPVAEEAKSEVATPRAVIENLDGDIVADIRSVIVGHQTPEAVPSDPSVASAGRGAGGDDDSSSQGKKKRTWKKPKDKPKRPLSSYNIFFQHQRSRIVDGYTEPASPDDIVRSIEGILTKKGEKRRHRKTHGRISFGDLARAIADAWKQIDPKSKSIFDHYAEVDMVRYKRELKAWKDKKESEEEQQAIQKHHDFMSKMSASFSGAPSSTPIEAAAASAADVSSPFAHLPEEGAGNMAQQKAQRRHSSPSSPGVAAAAPTAAGGDGRVGEGDLNNSFTSVDSNMTDFSSDDTRALSGGVRGRGSSSSIMNETPESMKQIMNRQQQILQQQIRESGNNFMLGNQIPNHGPDMMMHGSFSSIQSGSHPGMMNTTGMSPQQQMLMLEQQQHMIEMQQRQLMLSGAAMQQQQQQQQQHQAGPPPPTVGMQFESPLQHPVRKMMGSGGGGGFGNWNSAAGNSSMQSLQPTESLFTPSNHGHSSANHVSDYSSSMSQMNNSAGMMGGGGHSSFSSSMGGGHMSHEHGVGSMMGGGGSGMNNSYSSGFHVSDGLAPPVSSFNNPMSQMGHNSFSDMRFMAGRQHQQQQLLLQRGSSTGSGSGQQHPQMHNSFSGGSSSGMDISDNTGSRNNRRGGGSGAFFR